MAVSKKFLFANPCAAVEFPARVDGLFRPHYVTWSEQQKIEFAAPINELLLKSAGGLVGAGRFERPTPCAQGRCATRLRYAPTLDGLFILKQLLD
jgi:hypothetical protein